MRERGIVFSGWSVPLLLSGKKTQTRRVVNKRLDGLMLRGQHAEWCPYGKPGDLLYVKESIWTSAPKDYKGPGRGPYRVISKRVATGQEKGMLYSRFISSRYMPKWAARIWLEITQVRCERVQDISIDDLLAEGCPALTVDEDCSQAYEWWRDTWDALNAKRGHGYDVNDWVWALTYKRVEHGHQGRHD